MHQSTKIIDPHIHLWNPKDTPKNVRGLVKMFGRWPWLLERVTSMVFPQSVINFVGKPKYFLNNHLPETYHKDTGKYQIEGYVHIQAGWEGKKPFNSVGETEWLMTLKDKPLAIIGEAHLHDLKHLDAVLDAHESASPLFRGVRDSLAVHSDKGVMDFNELGEVLRRDDWRKGYARLGERNLTFDTFLYAHQLPDFIDLVQSHPETKVVLDHVGTPVGLSGYHGGVGRTSDERKRIQESWYQNLAELAKVPHVRLKLSGLLMTFCGFHFEDRENPASLTEVLDAIAPHIEYAIETFGIDRCMFASNFPVDKVSTSFETLYDAYFKIVEDLPIEDKKKLFFDNAVSFYNLDI